MLAVFDVGNTNIVLGVYEGKNLLNYWRIATDVQKSADEYGIIIEQFFKMGNIEVKEIESTIICSVVPSIMYTLEHMTRKYFGKDALVVGPGIKTGMNIKLDNPREVGADRIVNAVAAFELYGGPCIIVDFGTATTYCAVSEKGEYLGGAISPGIRISSDALFEKTAKLPRIEIVKPEHVIGKNTVASMQSGIFFGVIGQVDYIVRRMKQEIGCSNCKIIATGGLSKLISTESETIEIVNALLTLEGLRIIYERNRS